MNLVEAIQKQTMSSRDIAKLCEKRHDNVLSDIRKMLESLNIQSPELLVDYKDSKGRTFQEYKLPKRETLILVSGYNIELRAKIIDRWEKLELDLANKQEKKETRSVSRLEYRPMTDAIALAHEEIKPYHFSNEADLINRIVLGCTSSKFRKENDILDGDAIRDYLTKTQLDCIISLQRANTVYIEDGIDFQDRKVKLQSLFDRKFKEKLIQETHLINA